MANILVNQCNLKLPENGSWDSQKMDALPDVSVLDDKQHIAVLTMEHIVGKKIEDVYFCPLTKDDVIKLMRLLTNALADMSKMEATDDEDDMEDIYIAEKRLEDLRVGESKVVSLEDVMKGIAGGEAAKNKPTALLDISKEFDTVNFIVDLIPLSDEFKKRINIAAIAKALHLEFKDECIWQSKQN